MNLKKLVMSVKGWFPQEPKLPKNQQINSQKLTQSKLRWTNPLRIVYGLTLGSNFIIYLLFITDYISVGTSSISVLTVLMWNLPIFFLYNSPALAIFCVVFLTKGNGLNYFRSWKLGKELHLSILSIVIGYSSIALQHFYFPFTTQINFSGSGIQVIPSYYYLIYFGLSLIIIGFVSLILLYKKNHYMNNQIINEKIDC
jgi:hypothetical protein